MIIFVRCSLITETLCANIFPWREQAYCVSVQSCNWNCEGLLNWMRMRQPYSERFQLSFQRPWRVTKHQYKGKTFPELIHVRIFKKYRKHFLKTTFCLGLNYIADTSVSNEIASLSLNRLSLSTFFHPSIWSPFMIFILVQYTTFSDIMYKNFSRKHNHIKHPYLSLSIDLFICGHIQNMCSSFCRLCNVFFYT